MPSAAQLQTLIPLLTSIISAVSPTAAGATRATPTIADVSVKLATLQVPFVPNAGQWDKRAAFAAHTFAGTIFVTTDGKLVHSLPGKPPHGARSYRTSGWVLSETFVDADKHSPRFTKPVGQVETSSKTSFLVGDVKRHTAPLDTFERVRLNELYPGIALELRAHANNVEKIFTIEARHDPARIQLRVDGAKKLSIGNGGELIVHTGDGRVTYTAPIAYQENHTGKRSEIKVAYAIDAANKTYGFSVGEYDRRRALIIDPLLQSTYLGAGGNDIAHGLAIHPVSGEIYVVGNTTSADFPGVTGGAQSSLAGLDDVFISRFNAELTTLLQTTFLGGSGNDFGLALALDPANGLVYVAGSTNSTDFHGATGGAQQTYGGAAADGFVSRLSSDLTTLGQSTYLGGSQYDTVRAVVVDATSGDVYVTGETGSTNFPSVTGGAQATNAGGSDAFVSRLNAGLTAIGQSTYLGGSGSTGNDFGYRLAVHPASGDVYVAGSTVATDFPGAAGGAQANKAGGSDAFVSRINSALTTLTQSTYLGGALGDFAFALGIHPLSGEIYLAGHTDSTDFPGVTGGAQANRGGGIRDGYVSRLSADLSALTQSTYLGGANDDVAWALTFRTRKRRSLCYRRNLFHRLSEHHRRRTSNP